VRTLTCAEQYRAMAFAQLTYRESLRDIETCLAAQASALPHGLLRARAALDAGRCQRARDWRIYAELAQRLIAQARRLYAGDSLGLDLDNTVYALDSTTIDLCLSVFPWAHFRTTKAAVKMHTLLDLKGSIPSFIHISDGKLQDSMFGDLPPPATPRGWPRCRRWRPSVLAAVAGGWKDGECVIAKRSRPTGRPWWPRSWPPCADARRTEDQLGRRP
jgi:hypothetical protein